MPGAFYDSIYLSPHLDDAVLSCGGQILLDVSAGRRVLVVTVLAGDPPPGELGPLASQFHVRFGLGRDAVAQRRIEDRRAIESLGAELVHWDLPECIYRRDPANGRPLYDSLPALFRAPRREDVSYATEVLRRLRDLPPASRRFAPLAVGGHVDHRLVRNAALALPGNLSLYEDFPYARWRLAWWRARCTLPRRLRLEAEVTALDAAALSRKCRAITAYASQVPFLFGTRERLEKSVLAHARRSGGERVWKIARQ